MFHNCSGEVLTLEPSADNGPLPVTVPAMQALWWDMRGAHPRTVHMSYIWMLYGFI